MNMDDPPSQQYTMATSIMSSPPPTFRKREKIKVKPLLSTSIALTSEKTILRLNLGGLVISAVILKSTDIHGDMVWYAFGCLFVICLGNMIVTVWTIVSRTASIERDTRILVEERSKNTDSPLRRPRDLVRDRELLSSTGQTPRSLITATPSRHTSPFIGTPRSEQKNVLESPPTFSTVYGTPRSERVVSPYTQNVKTPRGTPLQTSATDYASAISSPLPDSGSPHFNRVATEHLSTWTDQLRQSPLSSEPTTPIQISQEAKSVSTTTPSRTGKVISHKTINFDSALVELGLSCNIEEITENLRIWFAKKLIHPLKEDIDDVTKAFSEAGLDHLAPRCPASFSLFAKSAPTGNSISDSFILTTTGFTDSSKPQTLLELGQKNANIPVVQKRLRLERYLSFAGLASQRAAVLRRINELAEDNLASAFRWSSSILRQTATLSTRDTLDSDDSLILIHLFCTFMDENLPSEKYYDAQPFSSRHFVALEDKPSPRPNNVQIQHVQRQPPQFCFIAGDKIYQVDQGAHSILHAIIFMIEYLHRQYDGYLGVGNLASPAIDLISILNPSQ